MSKREREMGASPMGRWRRRYTDRANTRQCAELLAASGWHTMLEQFARVTSLTTTLFDLKCQPRIGPFTPTPLAQRLAAARCWEAGGMCLTAEIEAARECMKENKVVQRTELNMLALFAVPLHFADCTIGAIVAGWNFDGFPDPILIDRLAKRINAAFPELWQIARQQPPVSREKLSICAGLLQTLANSFAQQRAETLKEQAHSQELLALNQSARTLAAAASLEEMGAAVIEATLVLAQTAQARLIVIDDDGARRIIAAHGFGDDQTHVSFKNKRRAITNELRVPIEAPDGTLLGVIEIAENRDFPAARYQMQISALAAQTAVALQKLRLFADLERERARLEEANRMKDEFLSVLSHELRTPLTPILGWISMLEQSEADLNPDARAEAIAAIKRNALQQLHLVDELLDLSRILNNKILLEPELISPTDALAVAFAAGQTLVRSKQIHFKLETEQNLPLISADAKRLQQILSNLISNAVKFTSAGGTITLGARRSPVSNAVEFFVADTGIGIKPELLPHIFDRFRQADSTTTRRFGGLGIGLSVVRGLVETQGGRVWAESDGEGRGAIFIVRFPAATIEPRIGEPRSEEMPPQEIHRVEEKSGAAPTPRNARALIVDDSTDTREVIKMIVSMAGYETADADSVESALEVTRRFKPDIILSDIGMPGSDGFEFLRRLREDAALTSVPVVALTGYASSLDREAALNAGFAAHISKPVEPSALIAALDKILETI
jgi:signal transduction histidine kinase